MYAIVEIAGKQFKVTKKQCLYTPKLGLAVGTVITFDKALLLGNDNDVKVGEPNVVGAKVTGKVLEHIKGDKIIVFKKKKRKGYKKKQGHRQDYTKILVEDIIG